MSYQKIDAWMLLINQPYPQNTIWTNGLVVNREPCLSIMTSWRSYFLLPDNHALKRCMIDLAPGQELPIQSEGMVTAIGPVSMLTARNLEFLKKNLTREEFAAVITSNSWVCIDYSNLNPPDQQFAPVKLSVGERRKDLNLAIGEATAYDQEDRQHLRAMRHIHRQRTVTVSA